MRPVQIMHEHMMQIRHAHWLRSWTRFIKRDYLPLKDPATVIFRWMNNGWSRVPTNQLWHFVERDMQLHDTFRIMRILMYIIPHTPRYLIFFFFLFSPKCLHNTDSPIQSLIHKRLWYIFFYLSWYFFILSYWHVNIQVWKMSLSFCFKHSGISIVG